MIEGQTKTRRHRTCYSASLIFIINNILPAYATGAPRSGYDMPSGLAYPSPSVSESAGVRIGTAETRSATAFERRLGERVNLYGIWTVLNCGDRIDPVSIGFFCRSELNALPCAFTLIQLIPQHPGILRITAVWAGRTSEGPESRTQAICKCLNTHPVKVEIPFRDETDIFIFSGIRQNTRVPRIFGGGYIASLTKRRSLEPRSDDCRQGEFPWPR